MKIFIALLVIGVLVGASSANAEEVACYGEKGQPFYDPDFCKAIRVSHEAFELNRKLLDKSEAIRQSIERQLKRQLEELATPKPRP